MAGEIAPVEQARAGLHALAEALDGVRFPLGGPEHAGRALVDELAWTIRGYLLPRLGDVDAPLVAVLIGSTGCGKSTILNSLARDAVSPTSVVRPTTTNPVVWCHFDHAARYTDGPLAILEPLVIGAADPLLRHLTVIDAPDVDSVETSHRAIADALLQAADVCLFITTPQRYADAVPWEFLRQAHRRDVPLMYVMNRTRAEPDPTIIADFVARMEAGGLVAEFDEVIPIPEQTTDPGHGGLAPAAVSHIRSILVELAELDSELTVSQATLGAFDDVVRGIGSIEAAAAEDEATIGRLRAGFRQAARLHRGELETSLAAGTLLRSEIVNHWSDLISGGQFSRAINDGLQKVRSWRRRTLGGGPDRVEGEARGEVAAIIIRHIDLAASDAAAAWDLDPVGRGLLDRSLWRMDPKTSVVVERALEDWAQDVRRLVEAKGGDRQTVARAASLGVNAVAVVAILAVFSHSGGITGGEVGIAAGAAAAQQAILEKVFGGAAMRTLLADARQGLVDAINACFESDLFRFEGILTKLEPRGLDALPAHRSLLLGIRETLGG